MKKKLTLIAVVAVLVVALSVILVGCSDVGKIDKLAKTIADAKSVTIETTITATVLEKETTAVTITKVTENAIYTENQAGKMYMEYVDGKLFTYTYNATTEKWSKNAGVEGTAKNYVKENTSIYAAVLMSDLYEYSKDKKGFVLKNAGVLTGAVDTVLTLDINGFTTTTETSLLGKTKTVLKVSNINTTILTAPKID